MQSYIQAIETKLNDYIQRNLSASCMPFEIGRKEFDEWVIDINPNVLFYMNRKREKQNRIIGNVSIKRLPIGVNTFAPTSLCVKQMKFKHYLFI